MIVPGTRLGPYAITATLGAGGMGEICKATDTRLDRTIATECHQHDPRLVRIDLEFRYHS